jgi:hypothetical protein
MKQIYSILSSNTVQAQDSTIYTKDGVPLEVRNTGNNTLVELYKLIASSIST